MASCAARLISAGAEKSGKPCARLTASYCIACRVISRITDSVKCSTLSERKCLGRAETGVMESKASTRIAHVGRTHSSVQRAKPAAYEYWSKEVAIVCYDHKEKLCKKSPSRNSKRSASP